MLHLDWIIIFFMKGLHKNVWILTLVQPLLMSISSMVVLVGGIIGSSIAPSENLATLPVASVVIGTALFVVPVTLVMKKYGRKKVFLFVTILSGLLALLTSYAIAIQSFYLFCALIFLMGIGVATVMQFRFAAIESVSAALIPKAASTVLVGGMFAAFLGPELAVRGKDLLETPFSGSFLLLAGVFVAAFLILLLYKNINIESTTIPQPTRSLREISRQQVFWVAILSASVGYMIMSFIMTATPVSMHVMDGHSLENTKWVIQSHILAMFVPSLFTGHIINKIGVTRMMLLGLVAYLICIAIAYAGHHLNNYWISLILLGIGWNFLFIGGTTLLPNSYRPEERFRVQAVNEAVVMGSQALASLSAGWVVFALGWETMLLLTIPIVLLQIIIILNWAMKSKKTRLQTS